MDTDGGGALDLRQRVRGDVTALADFARELSQLGDGPEAGQHRSARLHADPAGDVGLPGRINADPATVEQGLAKLVLSLVDLLRRLLEKQAIRRMEGGSLSDDEIERMGETFLRLERRMAELKAAFGLADEDLDLNLGLFRELISEP